MFHTLGIAKPGSGRLEDFLAPTAVQDARVGCASITTKCALCFRTRRLDINKRIPERWCCGWQLRSRPSGKGFLLGVRHGDPHQGVRSGRDQVKYANCTHDTPVYEVLDFAKMMLEVDSLGANHSTRLVFWRP